jgi:hypothetical protein
VDAADLFFTAARLGLLFTGLLLPGAMLLRALRLPPTLAGSFLASAALLYASVVLGTLLHVPLSLGTLAAALGLATLVATAWSRRTGPPPAPVEGTGPFSFLFGLGAWSPLYALFWAVIIWRLVTQPLNGGDVDFRWSWLAEQLLQHRTLDFYPPLTAADFGKYFWIESIPPGVASLHAWAYACGGSTREVWASAGVWLQLLALHDLVWRLAFNWGGRPAARRAVLLAAAVPMLNWSFLMGQETGLTALAVCGLCFALTRWLEARTDRWLALAAIAAVVGASSREYGLAFPALGLAGLLLLRAPRRALLIFAALALPLAVAWPVRTWVLTGNPFYSLRAGGLFPVHAFFVDWAASISSDSPRVFSTWAGWLALTRYLVLFAPAALLGWLAVTVQVFRRQLAARWCILCIAVPVALWFASVRYTGGGLFYSLRVLSPAFALGAAFGGFTLSALRVSLGMRRAWDLGLIALVLVTLPSTLTLPQNPSHLSPKDWLAAGNWFVDGSRRTDAELSRQLATMPDHDRILSECVSLPRSLAPAGIAVVPLWSPEVAWLFDRHLPPAEVARHWHHSGLHYVVMTRSPAQLEFLARRAMWVEPFFKVRKAWQSDAYIVLEVSTPGLAP